MNPLTRRSASDLPTVTHARTATPQLASTAAPIVYLPTPQDVEVEVDDELTLVQLAAASPDELEGLFNNSELDEADRVRVRAAISPEAVGVVVECGGGPEKQKQASRKGAGSLVLVEIFSLFLFRLW